MPGWCYETTSSMAEVNDHLHNGWLENNQFVLLKQL